MIDLALAFLAGGVATVTVLTLLARRMDAPAGERESAAYQCESCGDRFRTEVEATQHVMSDHRAPDVTTAAHHVAEVDDVAK